MAESNKNHPKYLETRQHLKEILEYLRKYRAGTAAIVLKYTRPELEKPENISERRQILYRYRTIFRRLAAHQIIDSEYVEAKPPSYVYILEKTVQLDKAMALFYRKCQICNNRKILKPWEKLCGKCKKKSQSASKKQYRLRNSTEDNT